MDRIITSNQLIHTHAHLLIYIKHITISQGRQFSLNKRSDNSPSTKDQVAVNHLCYELAL